MEQGGHSKYAIQDAVEYTLQRHPSMFVSQLDAYHLLSSGNAPQSALDIYLGSLSTKPDSGESGDDGPDTNTSFSSPRCKTVCIVPNKSVYTCPASRTNTQHQGETRDTVEEPPPPSEIQPSREYTPRKSARNHERQLDHGVEPSSKDRIVSGSTKTQYTFQRKRQTSRSRATAFRLQPPSTP